MFADLTLWAQRIPEFNSKGEEWFEAQFEDQTPANTETYLWLVSGLRPFTKYRFKVVFGFSTDLSGIETQPSLIISTRPDPNIPPSKPILHKVEQVIISRPKHLVYHRQGKIDCFALKHKSNDSPQIEDNEGMVGGDFNTCFLLSGQ